jgi:hypothetical protein
MDKYAFLSISEAYVFFKQLDNEVVRYPIEVRLTGADETTLKSMSKELIRDLSKMDGPWYITMQKIHRRRYR